MSAQSDFKKLVKVMRRLPAKLQGSIVTGGTRAAAALVRDEVKERADEDTGELKRAIRVKKARTRRGANAVHFRVYVKKVILPNGKHGLKNTQQYAYYKEYGTKYMQASPFFRTGFESVGNRPVERARAYMKKRLPRELKKIRGGR